MNRVLIAAVAVIIIGAGIFGLTRNSSNSNNSNSSNTSGATTQPSTTSPPANRQTSAATITYDGNGFSPAALTVNSGTTVTIKNTSNQELQMDSNPHPIHTDDTDLNVGLVGPGGSQTFTVTKTGTFGYHNHLDPTQTGTIIIN